ncbi:hypothetical protein O988_00959, partial [Pseudogymnoascus sp. VKM F-3808]
DDMASREQVPDESVPAGGGGGGTGAPPTQHLRGSFEEVRNERREQGGGPGGNEIPESLRAGPQGWAESTNPFVRAQHTGNPPAPETAPAVNPWASEEGKGGPDANLPDANVPEATDPLASGQQRDPNVTNQFQNLNIAEQNTNPWEGPVEDKSTVEGKPLPHSQPAPPSLGKEDSGNEAWSSTTPPARTPPTQPNPASSDGPPLINVDDTLEPSNWDDDQQDLFRTPAGDRVVTQDAENAWEEAPRESSGKEAVPAPDAAPQKKTVGNDGGRDPMGTGEQQSGVIDAAGRETSGTRPVPSRPPNLPPRNIGDSEEARTSHDESGAGGANSSAPPRQVNHMSEELKKETYAIKNITWFDVRATENPRITPILIQRDNGPCSLLALVNALTISSPPDLLTTLTSTLRTREEVSLELLLDVIIDELMSGRLGEELPDMTDLFTFLISLHKGMNVNPNYIAPAATNLANDPRRSMSHMHPSEREERIPGTFELTREIMLYGTFLIPLIHGWLPEPGSPVYAAFKRSARSYDDAQHLLFREQELEDKFTSDGLSFEEQGTFDDIITIRSFLSSTKMQLTTYGLETIRRALAPGSVAIFFRNDHFSTLYKEPQSEQLMHLVTDVGLAGHDEVVWESLPDINGKDCEFYSGDFRPVGGNTQSRQAPSDGRSGRRSPERSTNTSSAPSDGHQRVASSASEQEDHDLALAFQMQDEENQRHEQETARRRRESGLNQQQQDASHTQNNNNIPVSRFDGANSGRRSAGGRGSSQAQTQSPTQPPASQRTNPVPAGDAEVLPSYEHAATQPRFEPPPNHPLHLGMNPDAAQRSQGQRGGGARQGQSARPLQGTPQPQPVGGSGARRQNQNGRGRDKDCIVM